MIDKKKSAARWGPSEWFGHDVSDLTADERLALAQDALKPAKSSGRTCPFMSDVSGVVNTQCNKKGGVCSVQLYGSNAKSSVTLAGTRVAICPARLVNRSILRAVAEKVLGTKRAVLVKEVPYSISLVNKTTTGKPVAGGRIDWLLVDGKRSDNFCAVETQSVYMSGKSQDHQFRDFVTARGALVLPTHTRHPDYKSSVPKRLAPQLESKARHLSASSKKTVVIIDEFVQQNMSVLREVQVPDVYSANPTQLEQRKLDTCEVIFAIVALQPGGALKIKRFLFSSINDARDSLNAVAAMTQREFFETVSGIVRPPSGQPNPKKVFPLY